jgi:hypothetical protein
LITSVRDVRGGIRINKRTSAGVTDTPWIVHPGSAQDSLMERSQNRALAGIFNGSRRRYMVHTT